ncbi:rRNA biogenesis protein rrp36 [Neurospora sp. IMI 360204]|nr:rRNA biogenesis protein rrp36 [Neurospora sp. IMI 360204]
MPAVKRKAPPTLGAKLQRRVRPRFEAEPDSDVEGSSDEAPSEEEGGGFHTGSDTEEEDKEIEEGSEAGSDDESDAPSEHGGAGIDASQLSFGALARAQASLGALKKKKKSKGGDEESSDEEEKEEPNWKTEIEKGMKAKVEKHHRTSKHAPVEMTSKKPVSRRRDFLANNGEPAKPKSRDPRFAPPGIGGGSSGGSKGVVDEIKVRKAYSFLDDYQEDEMKQLRMAIKKTKDANEKEQLQRALLSMESKKKARVRKDKERELLSEHKKKEKELIKQGKTPFYLKKSEQKKQLLVEQFASMKKSQVDKAIERKRKKIAGKEKKALPLARRTAEDR